MRATFVLRRTRCDVIARATMMLPRRHVVMSRLQRDVLYDCYAMRVIAVLRMP